MGVVTGDTVRFLERLAVVRLHQIRVLRVVAVQAKRRWVLFQMLDKLEIARGAGLVDHMAGVAAGVQGRVAAALLRRVLADGVAFQAEILLRPAGQRLQQLIGIVAGMGVVALEAIADGGLVDGSFDVRGILIGMAGEAQGGGSGGDELDPRHILAYPDFVTACAAQGYRRMDVFPFGLIRVALQALGRIRVLVERNRVHVGKYRCAREEEEDQEDKG